ALDEQRFYVFALSAGMAQLYECDHRRIHKVDVEGMPSSLEDVTKYRDPEQSLQQHTGTATASGGNAAQFHGQGGGADDTNAILLDYFHGCDRALHSYLAERSIPLVLAALDENAGL